VLTEAKFFNLKKINNDNKKIEGFFQNIKKLVKFMLEEQSVPKISQFFGQKKQQNLMKKNTEPKLKFFLGGEVSKSFIVG
jgi:single-stranded DNA-specific DHH superfamily exonuclease